MLYILFGLFLWYHGNLAQIVIKINVVIHKLWPSSGSSKASFPGKKEEKKKSFLFIRLSLYNRKCYVTSTCTKKVQYFLPIHVHVQPQSNKSGKIRSRSISRHTMREKGIWYMHRKILEKGDSFFFIIILIFNM